MMSLQELVKARKEAEKWSSRMKDTLNYAQKNSGESVDANLSAWSLIRGESSLFTELSMISVGIRELRDIMEQNFMYYSAKGRCRGSNSPKSKEDDDIDKCTTIAGEGLQFLGDAEYSCKEALSLNKKTFVSLADQLIRSDEVHLIEDLADVSTLTCITILKSHLIDALKGHLGLKFALGNLQKEYVANVQANINNLSGSTINVLPNKIYACSIDARGHIRFSQFN